MQTTQRPRGNSLRRIIGSTIALVVMAPGLSPAAAPARDRGGGAQTGLIVASDIYLLTTPFASAATLVEAMDRLKQPQPIGAYCAGAWRVHFVALFERAPADETLNLTFYDLSSSGSAKQRIHVFTSPIPIPSGETTVFLNDFVVSKDLGFRAGHRYEVSLARPAGSDGSELAKGTFVLK